MKKIIFTTLVGLFILLSACADPNSPEQILKKIWTDYHNLSGNEGADDRNEKGQLIKVGTVPPSAMNSTVEERLPAYLACYDFLMVTSYGDTKANLCMYYKRNPSMGRYSIQWRGKDMIYELEEFMRNDGFVEG